MRVLHGRAPDPLDEVVVRVWGALKTSLASSPTLTIAGRIHQVHAFRERTPAQMLAAAAPASSPWLPEGYMQNHEQVA